MAVLDAATHPVDAMESLELLAHQQPAHLEFPAPIVEHLTATSWLTVPGITLTPTPTSSGSALLGKVTTTGDQLLCHALAELSSSPLATVVNMSRTGFENAHPSRLFQSPPHAKKIAVQFVTEMADLFHQEHPTLDLKKLPLHHQ